jgi:hypothetical protein
MRLSLFQSEEWLKDPAQSAIYPILKCSKEQLSSLFFAIDEIAVHAFEETLSKKNVRFRAGI